MIPLGVTRQPCGWAALLVGLALPAIGLADPISQGRWTVDGGGVSAVQAGPYVVGATVGQPDAGILAAGTYQLTGGFWGPGLGLVVGVDDDHGGNDDPHPDPPLVVPSVARIYAAVPNPVLERTAIAFDLPEPSEIEVRIFDITGAQVRAFGSSVMPAGRHAIQWNVTDGTGRRVATGIYLARVRLGSLTRQQKLMVLR